MESSWPLLALISVFAAILITKIIKIQRRPEQKLRPPGPKPWPIIGNLNLLGSLPHQSLHHLSQKYGEIMQLKFGKFPVVIASSPKMAEQFLKVHDANFASRPPLAAGKHISYNYSDVSFAPYGPYWREARKIFMMELFTTKKLDNLEQIRVEERRFFLSRLKCKCFSDSEDKPAVLILRDHISRYILSTICRMYITDKYFGESEDDLDVEDGESRIMESHDVQEMMEEWFLLSGAFNIGDWIPWLGFLDLQGYMKKMRRLRKKTDRLFGYVIDDHIAKMDAAAAAGKAEKADLDFVDVLVQMAKDPNAQIQLTRDSMKSLIMNVVLGGADTSVITMEWGVQEMLRQPRIMERAKEEMERVIGRERWVEERDELPYVDAIIMETFRLHPVATLLAPHYAIHDCNVAGYNISKGTTVLVNTWSIGRDPNLWDAPEEFLPERFLGKRIDMTGSNFAMLPFGSGRRGCPGYNLGLKIVRTTLANLLHGFELKLVEGMRPQDISMEEKYGLTTNPKHPLSIIIKPTLPSHLY